MVKRILLDADILQYEIAFAAEAYWKHLFKEKELEPPADPQPFVICIAMVDERISNIVSGAEGEGEPFLFFTGSQNYRDRIAVTQPYKDRDSDKPFHYKNIKAYLQSRYQWQQVEGLEADDLIGIAMTKNPDKYTCATRDKDLRQISGFHYGWELGNQPAFGPRHIGQFGWIELSSKRDKIIGGGDKFLYSQILTGDSVDTIPGIPKYGAVKAFKTLEACTTLAECEEAVLEAYRGFYGDGGRARMLETARLVYLTRVMNDDKVLLWNFLGEPEQWMNIKTGEVSEE